MVYRWGSYNHFPDIMMGVRITPRHLSNMFNNTSYHDHQEYIWFMGRDLNHFQDNFQIVK